MELVHPETDPAKPLAEEVVAAVTGEGCPQEQLCIPCAASLQIYENKGNVDQEGDDDYLTSNNQYDVK